MKNHHVSVIRSGRRPIRPGWLHHPRPPEVQSRLFEEREALRDLHTVVYPFLPIGQPNPIRILVSCKVFEFLYCLPHTPTPEPAVSVQKKGEISVLLRSSVFWTGLLALLLSGEALEARLTENLPDVELLQINRVEANPSHANLDETSLGKASLSGIHLTDTVKTVSVKAISND